MKKNYKKNQQINLCPMRQPSKVMKLERLGSFHQTRLSFTRQLINELKSNKTQFEISKWDIDNNGFGNAVIKTIFNNSIFSLVVFCHSINDEERSDRVIAEKWDMTFSLFKGVPSNIELDKMSKNLKIQELGRHLSKQLTLSRANKSVRIFKKVLDALSNGKQPSKLDINNIGYLVRTTAVYGNGKFGIGDFSFDSSKSVLNKPFQAEMLTVYLIRYFSIELINFLAEKKGGKKSVKLSNKISRHLGVGNATGLGMAPFLINHQELIHKWINTRETAISRVLSIKSINKNTQKQIINYIEQGYRYTSQWNVDDLTQANRIKNLNSDLKDISIVFSYTLLPNPKDNEILKRLVNQTYTHYLNADKSSQTSLCNDPNLFTTSILTSTSYNCTNRHLIPGSTYFTSDKTMIFHIVYTLFTIVVFIWLSMYRSKYMKQRRDYILSELVQMIGCVLFMIILLIRLIMSMNQLSGGIVFHLFGLIAMYVSFVMIDIICTLGGKKPIHAMLEYTNIFQHYYALFEALTNIRDGKYYFHYIIMFEVV